LHTRRYGVISGLGRPKLDAKAVHSHDSGDRRRPRCCRDKLGDDHELGYVGGAAAAADDVEAARSRPITRRRRVHRDDPEAARDVREERRAAALRLILGVRLAHLIRRYDGANAGIADRVAVAAVARDIGLGPGGR
jgi:hypothetical protein